MDSKTSRTMDGISKFDQANHIEKKSKFSSTRF